MSSKQIGPVLKAWYKWKALRLPWRKQFLVGLDLQGNTYWEFRDVRGDAPPDPSMVRWRRIVKYPRSTHYSEIKISPQWHQWLRHQREHAPTLNEQAYDIARQAQMKILASEADARWAAKPSYLDRPAEPEKTQPAPALDTGKTQPQDMERERQGEVRPEKKAAKGNQKADDLWKKARGPSEDWQPTAWTPGAAKRR